MHAQLSPSFPNSALHLRTMPVCRWALLITLSVFWLPAQAQNQSPTLVSNSRIAPGTVATSPLPDQRQNAADQAMIPLPPPGKRGVPSQAEAKDVRGPIFTVTSSLAIVLGLFCGFVWLSRKTTKGRGSILSNNVFTVLGTSAIDVRNKATLVKCGNRVLLLAMTPGGVSTLAEYTDPSEVNDLLASTSGDAKAAFSHALHDAGDGQPATGFVDPQQPIRRGLFSG